MSNVQPLQFGEKYVLLDRVGTGGVAEVFRGKLTRDQGFEKLIVIKKLLAEHNRNREMIDIFIREARLAALLQHDNIAATYDFGEIDGEYFLAMEYLFGKNLHSIMARVKEKPELFGLPEALLICSKICEGMAYAHNLKDLQNNPLNLVHRDLTPHNIFITYDGKVKVLDFGVAKAELFDNKTRDGVVKGKISYMSPERLSGEAVDHRSDIFSIGILLYEMIAKRRMYQGDTAELIRKCLTADYQPLISLVPDLDPAVQAVLDRALAVDVDQRYQSCAEMHTDIDDLIFGLEQRADSRLLKDSICSLFAEEYEVEHRTVARVRQVDGAPGGWRDKTDIAINGRRSRTASTAPEDRTAFLLHRPPVQVVKLYAARLGVWIRQQYQQLRELAGGIRLRPLHLAGGGAFLLLVVVVAALVSSDGEDLPGDDASIPMDSPPQVPVAATGEIEVDSPVAVAADDTKTDGARNDPSVAGMPAAVQQQAPEPADLTKEIPPAGGDEAAVETVVSGAPVAGASTDVPVLRSEELKKKKDTPSVARQTTAPPAEKNSVRNVTLPMVEPQLAVVDMGGKTLSFEEDSEQLARRQRLRALHVKANEAMQKGRLIEPGEQSAYAYYNEILQLDPKDNHAADGLRRICEKYSELAELSLAVNDYSRADEYVESGLRVIYDYSRLVALQKRIDRERQDHIFELSEKARLCLDADKLSTPANDSAYFYYTEISRIDPGNSLVEQGYKKIADRYAQLGDEAFGRFDYQMADRYVRRGLQIIPDHYYLLYLKDELARSDLGRVGHSVKKKLNKLLSN
jgi:serine/threonine protein kinase